MIFDQEAIYRMRLDRQEGWDESLRFDYPLTDKSVVWDVGAWNGEFTREIFQRYDCTIHTFEVLDRRNVELAKEFHWNRNKILVHPYGLGGKPETVMIKDADDCTSPLISGTLPIDVREASPLLVEPIDLMKINIEGYEYPLIDNLAENDKLRSVNYLQIQFHDYLVLNGVFLPIADAEELYEKAVAALSKTHEQQWCYPYVWESWKRR